MSLSYLITVIHSLPAVDHSLYAVFKVQSFRLSWLSTFLFPSPSPSGKKGSGLKWTRTTDLTLIRRAL